MARPERNNVDYFPFLCKEGKAMYYIEQKYGNDGYASWVKILRQLAVTNYHYLNLSDKIELMYLASKCRVSEEVLSNLIEDLCSLGEFNEDLWKNNRILFNQKFVDNIKDAYSKRNSKLIDYHSFFQSLLGLSGKKLGNCVKNTPNIPYTILEDIKEENNIWSFDDFWKNYPSKHGKKKAKEKWDSLSKFNKEKIQKTFQIFLDDIPFKGYNYPYATTYLNQQRWNDYEEPKNEEGPDMADILQKMREGIDD